MDLIITFFIILAIVGGVATTVELISKFKKG